MRTAWARKANRQYRNRAQATVVAAMVLIGGCSSDGSGSATTVAPASSTVPVTTSAQAPQPRVDLIQTAVTALETKLGAPQEYFEINVTAQLVNLFVALNDGTVAQAWVYLDGELSSKEGQPAAGHTFTKSALDFDPAKVLTQVEAQLPQSHPDVFFVEGGDGGIVRYSLALTSLQGGQLVVVVDKAGKVLSVET
jgi:hypothetical protein